MSKKGKNTGTFVVKIHESKNSTWQGKIKWADTNQEQPFRSALELLKLIDGAILSIEEEHKLEGGCHEN